MMDIFFLILLQLISNDYMAIPFVPQGMVRFGHSATKLRTAGLLGLSFAEGHLTEPYRSSVGDLRPSRDTGHCTVSGAAASRRSTKWQDRLIAASVCMLS